ncbi:ATP-binding protein [Candidatus Woesearchaeota archaeon]|nr:ATP-binding protein [Candidatus Woesearchaeota archaeon]
MKFYNRDKEIAIFSKIKKDFRIAILGRRRVGKTRLVEHFYKSDAIVFFIPAEKIEKQIIETWREQYPELHLPESSTFENFFSFVFFHYKDKIIFLDEIQNVIKVNKSFLFDLQRLIDKYKPKLIVTGSLISPMKEIIQEYQSPLYGRFDYVIKLDELSFKTVYIMGKDLQLKFEEIVLFYLFFGGIPKYYELVEKIEPFILEEFVAEMFIRYPRPLYEEVKMMLKEEFGSEYKMFFSILSAISQGKNKLSEIATSLGLAETKITKYIALLKDDFEIITRTTPIIDGKKNIYQIKNHMFSFWFDTLWRYNNLLEINAEKEFEESVKQRFGNYLGVQFENLLLELIRDNVIQLPFNPEKIGKQWGKVNSEMLPNNQYEIDIVAFNEKNKKIAFFECKLKQNVNAQKVLADLQTKAQYVHWNINNRTEYYFIIAKSFTKKIAATNGAFVFCIDLIDIENYLKKSIK